ncbi:MAG: YlxR family protein [Clostridia bacterium]
MEKKIPERMCLVCRQMKPKKEMLRLVVTNDGIVVDKSGKMNGRGGYICVDETCLEKCKRTKILNKLFKREIKIEFINEIEKAINEKKSQQN